jgi:phage gpG-like protein
MSAAAFRVEIAIDLPDMEAIENRAWAAMRQPVHRATLAVGASVSDMARRRLNKLSRGHLRASWLNSPVTITETGVEVEGRIGSNLSYAAIHDSGLPIIRPRRGKLLAIPAGSNKGYAHEELGRRGPRSYRGRWVPIRPGLFLFIEEKTDRVLFIGKPSVKIPATWYIRNGVEAGLPRASEVIAEGYTAEVQRLIDEGGE